MTGYKLTAIFIAVLFIDGFVLPALFNWRESFLSLLVLIVTVLYMGPTRKFTAFGLVFAFVLEPLRGLSFGDIALPFLLIVTVIFLTQRVLDIKHTHDTRFSLSKLVLASLASVAFVYLFSFFFRQGNMDIAYFSSAIVLTVALEALMLVLIFNSVFNQKSDYL